MEKGDARRSGDLRSVESVVPVINLSVLGDSKRVTTYEPHSTNLVTFPTIITVADVGPLQSSSFDGL